MALYGLNWGNFMRSLGQSHQSVISGLIGVGTNRIWLDELEAKDFKLDLSSAFQFLISSKQQQETIIRTFPDTLSFL
jgi:hypothetical protein